MCGSVKSSTTTMKLPSTKAHYPSCTRGLGVLCQRLQLNISDQFGSRHAHTVLASQLISEAAEKEAARKRVYRCTTSRSPTRKSSASILAGLFNQWYESKTIPSSMGDNHIILLPKKDLKSMEVNDWQNNCISDFTWEPEGQLHSWTSHKCLTKYHMLSW